MYMYICIYKYIYTYIIDICDNKIHMMYTHTYKHICIYIDVCNNKKRQEFKDSKEKYLRGK